MKPNLYYLATAALAIACTAQGVIIHRSNSFVAQAITSLERSTQESKRIIENLVIKGNSKALEMYHKGRGDGMILGASYAVDHSETNYMAHAIQLENSAIERIYQGANKP